MTRDPERFYVPLYMRPSSDRMPQKAEVLPSRKELFAGINAFVRKHGDGWLTSIPGEREVRMECMPESSLPDELRKLGYRLEPGGETERILPHAITTQIVSDVDGVLTPLTEGSSGRPVITSTHAGIVTVQRYSFTLP